MLSQDPADASTNVNGTYVILRKFDTNVDTVTGFGVTMDGAAYFRLNNTSGSMREAAPGANYLTIIDAGASDLADVQFWEKESYPSYPQTTSVAQCTKTASPDDRITCTDGRGFEFKTVIYRATPASTPALQWARAGVSLGDAYTDAFLYAADLRYAT